MTGQRISFGRGERADTLGNIISALIILMASIMGRGSRSGTAAARHGWLARSCWKINLTH